MKKWMAEGVIIDALLGMNEPNGFWFSTNTVRYSVALLFFVLFFFFLL